jgi:hypothetical protein
MAAELVNITVYSGPATTIQQQIWDTVGGSVGPYVPTFIPRDAAGDKLEMTAAGSAQADLFSVAGTAITAGAGAVTAGTLRVTHASDDPVVTAIQIIDDWDANDACRVVVPYTAPSSVAVTTSGAYAAGDVVGGIIEITTVNAASGRPVDLASIVVSDKNGNAVDLFLFFFRATPSGGTYTDNSALVWGSGDVANVVASVKILSTDWMVAASQSVVGVELGWLSDVDGTSVFLLIVCPTGSTPTYTNGNLALNLAFDRR